MPHDTPFSNDPSGMCRRWKAELRHADKSERDWRETARKIVARYRDDESQNRQDRRYNILWANTETLRPQLYSNTPKPAIRRRFYDQDPIGKSAAEVLQRALEYAIDAYDFDGTISRVMTDYLLTGRGVARIRYVPQFQVGDRPKVPVQVETTEDDQRLFMADMGNGMVMVAPDNVMEDDDGSRYTMGEPDEELEYEEVRCEYVNWEDFRVSPARTWGEVRWIAFRHRMTKEQLKEAFGAEAAANTPLDFEAQEDKTNEDSDEQHIAKRATVWEIWNKDQREVVFISEARSDAPIDVRKDPLNLEEFFPIPQPLYSVPTNNTQVPIPEYTLYQDQAIELNRITTRIDRLVEALKARGLYAGQVGNELDRLMNGDENELIPVEDWGAIQNNGGRLENFIAWMPIEQVAKTLQWLYQQRDQLLQTIYQVTGIADIMRGSTNPNEGVGTQRMKSQFGVMRLQPRQKQVQKFIRDLLELKAEVMSELFQPRTLSLMTGTQMPDQALSLMRNDGLRGFRIDIETDSTIAADENAEKEQIAEMFQALGGMMQQMMPAVQSGAMSQEAARSVVLWGLRRFRVSREVEEAFEQPPPPPEPEQPDPLEVAKLENERLKIANDARNQQMQRQMELMKLRIEADKVEDENHQFITEEQNQNMRHAIDALIKQEENDDQVFTAAMQQFGPLMKNGNGGQQ